ncbi:MAG TPA: dienelactone hydrolase family protein [Ignavibacteria bacterium]|nr:dienelactone hydrolase family protein [Ignavibacteria bacterium]HRJ98832.1 dienelactone hydrolase family protein [Ignavibacteria bacterium]
MTAKNIYSEIIEEDYEYKIGDKTFQGFIAYDNSSDGIKPGVIIVHQWKGLGEYEKMRARMLAESGYVAFAVDIYGKGIRPVSTEESSQEAGKYYADRNLFKERVNAGLTELTKMSNVDKSKIAAIGYCFGGSGVLELARSGAEINGVVSFHGSLKSGNPEDAKNIKTKVLILHGAVDPYVPESEVSEFKKEMENAVKDYILTEYSGAVHSFTNLNAGTDPSKGSAYNENADKRSWEAMKVFFKEIFSEK